MSDDIDKKDKDESRKIAAALIVLVILLGVAIVLMLPLLGEIVSQGLAPGLGLRDAAVIAFFVTVVLMIVLTLAAGDGLLGEVQYVLGAFITFFLIIWLMIAWIF